MNKKYFLITLLFVLGILQGTYSKADVVNIDCSTLVGSGSFSNPLNIGPISSTTFITGCPSLTPGSGFNKRSFIFRLEQLPTQNSAICTGVTSDSNSAVHPSIYAPSGVLVLSSGLVGFWFRGSDNSLWQCLPIAPPRINGTLPAGDWILDTSLLAIASSTSNFYILFYIPGT